MYKKTELIMDSEFDISKGPWELQVSPDGIKEFIFKEDLKTRIEKVLSNEIKPEKVNSCKVFIDLGDRLVVGDLLKIDRENKKCEVRIESKKYIVSSDVISPYLDIF